MDMRQGRQVGRAVLWSPAQSLSCRYTFDRTRINPSGSANFIGFQVLPSSNMSLMLWKECISDVELGFLVFPYCFVQLRVDRVTFSFFLQFWGFIGSCAFFTAFMFYPFCFAIGLLGTYPSIITDYIWPVIKNILIGLLVVQSLTIVFKIIAKTFLVLQIPASATN